MANLKKIGLGLILSGMVSSCSLNHKLNDYLYFSELKNYPTQASAKAISGIHNLAIGRFEFPARIFYKKDEKITQKTIESIGYSFARMGLGTIDLVTFPITNFRAYNLLPTPILDPQADENKY